MFDNGSNEGEANINVEINPDSTTDANVHQSTNSIEDFGPGFSETGKTVVI